MRRSIVVILSLATLIFAGGWNGRLLRAQDSTNPKPPAPNSQQQMPGMDMSHGGMSMGDQAHVGHEGHGQKSDDSPENNERVQADAMRVMHMGHHMDGAHMRMSPPRPATPEDWERATQIAATLRTAIEKYKDYRLALADGYRIFAPNLPQPEYHFTNYWNGFLEGFTFDPARPTSLLYRKTPGGGWELIGAMYTASRDASLEELNERVPLGVARWHVHTNLCLPRRGTGEKIDWKRFGLTGSISTPQACTEAGGRFYPQIFGWMVHVYPFESTPSKMFAQ